MGSSSKPATVLSLWPGIMSPGESGKHFEESKQLTRSLLRTHFTLFPATPTLTPLPYPSAPRLHRETFPTTSPGMVWPDLAAARGRIRTLCSGSTVLTPREVPPDCNFMLHLFFPVFRQSLIFFPLRCWSILFHIPSSKWLIAPRTGVSPVVLVVGNCLFNRWVGMIPWRGKWHPVQLSLLQTEEPRELCMVQGSKRVRHKPLVFAGLVIVSLSASLTPAEF